MGDDVERVVVMLSGGGAEWMIGVRLYCSVEY